MAAFSPRNVRSDGVSEGVMVRMPDQREIPWRLLEAVAEERADALELEVFEPRTDEEVPGRTVTRAKATCVACGAVLPPERMRAQLAAQRGGADVVFDAQGRRAGGARMLAVVMVQSSEQERQYRLPTGRDYEAVRTAQGRVAKILGDW